LKNLFNFIFKNAHWLLFFFLTSFSLYLLVNNNEFQRSKYLSVFQEIAGRVHSVSSGVQSYMYLKTNNAGLMQRIAELEKEIQVHKRELENLSGNAKPDFINTDLKQPDLDYIPARVTRNLISGLNNHIILNKGSKDGVAEDMAVVSVQGIVGVVTIVTTNYSRVMPVLNTRYNPSCMINRFPGTLSWDGNDPRYATLSRLPSHTASSIGDTVVTSGYSETFPEGVPVGIVEDAFKQKNEESNSLKVRLFTDFSTLKEVFIISNPLLEELKKIEKGVVEK